MELENLKRNRMELESTYSQRMESMNMETSRKVTTFEQNLTHLQREN